MGLVKREHRQTARCAFLRSAGIMLVASEFMS